LPRRIGRHDFYLNRVRLHFDRIARRLVGSDAIADAMTDHADAVGAGTIEADPLIQIQVDDFWRGRQKIVAAETTAHEKGDRIEIEVQRIAGRVFRLDHKLFVVHPATAIVTRVIDLIALGNGRAKGEIERDNFSGVKLSGLAGNSQLDGRSSFRPFMILGRLGEDWARRCEAEPEEAINS